MEKKNRAVLIFVLGAVCIAILFVASATVTNHAASDIDQGTETATNGEVVSGSAMPYDPLITQVPSGIDGSDSTPRPLTTDPQRGAASPTVTIVEFGDFECEACKRMSPIIEQIVQEYPNDVLHVWKDFPIPRLHENSETAAMAARCAQDQDSFWAYHDLLFFDQDQFILNPWVSIAEDIGLDTETFSECVSGTSKKQLVVQGYYIAKTLQIDSAPSYFINDTFVTGEKTIEEMRVLVEQEIEKIQQEG